MTAAAFDDTELMAGFRGVVELLFVRMKLGNCDEDIKVRGLVREEMPKVVGIVKLVFYLLGKYTYTGKHEKSVLSHLGSAVSWHERPSASSEVLMVCSASCKNLYAFIVSLYQGKRDYVFVEMADESHQKRHSGASYAEHGKFNLMDDLDKPFKQEKLQMENAAKYAAGIVLAVADSSQPQASSQAAAPSQEGDAEMLVDDDDDDNSAKDKVA